MPTSILPEDHTTVMSLGERTAPATPGPSAAARPSSLFQEVRHTWEGTYRDGDYMKLLHTFSDHRTLPEPDKTHFFRSIEDVVDRFGGVVHRRYETLLLLARKK